MLVGLTGVGGGSLMTPILVLLFGVHATTAVVVRHPLSMSPCCEPYSEAVVRTGPGIVEALAGAKGISLSAVGSVARA
jgi:hypothetical protein